MGRCATDRWGAPVAAGTGAGSPGLGAFEEAVDSLVTLRGDPVARAREAARHDLALARILSA